MPVVCCLDIETTGLDKHAGVITVISIALYDSQRKRTIQEFEFNACVARETSSDEEDDLKLRVKTILNGSECLVAYNGIHFDIPWLAHWIDASNVALLETWKEKTIDFLHEAKVRINRYIGMDHVASVNAIAISKIATGKQAVEWAKEKNWYVLVLCVIPEQKSDQSVDGQETITRILHRRCSGTATDFQDCTGEGDHHASKAEIF